MNPPPNKILPIIHSLRILHKDIYGTGDKLTKKDKLGIHSTIEKLCLETFSLSVEAALKPKGRKKTLLEKLRLKITVLKHLIRNEYELEIIDSRTYLRLAEQLVEISKMANGWLNYITQEGLPD